MKLIPHIDNENNKYILFIIIKILNIKTPKIFIKLIDGILKEYIFFEKNIKIIKHHEFWWLSITEVIIPDSVISIGEYSFMDCEKLKHISIPDSVEKIGRGAFGGCLIQKISSSDKIKNMLKKYIYSEENLTGFFKWG